MRELRINDRSDIVELAVIMKTGVCPFIVVFYGCLVRDVSECTMIVQGLAKYMDVWGFNTFTYVCMYVLIAAKLY